MPTKYPAIPMIFLSSLLGACGQAELAADVEPTPAYVDTLAVSPSAGYESVSSYTGRVEASLNSALAFEIGGTIAEVTAEEGDRVTQRQILARLDTARLAAQRAEASAGLARVDAELALANSTLVRVADAFSYQGVSRQELDEAEQQVSALAASQAVAQANLDRIDVDIDKATLRAAFDGTITQRYNDPGAVIAAGIPLVQLQSSSNLEVRIGVSPSAANALAVGDAHELSINGKPVVGVLRAVLDERDEITRTVDALFIIEDAGYGVRPGDTASLETTTWNDAPGYWLPLSSLVEGSRGLWQALVADSDGSQGYVLTGHVLEVLYADSDRAYVRGTLEAGDLIVRSGTQRVVAGQVVRLDESGKTEHIALAGDDDVD